MLGRRLNLNRVPYRTVSLAGTNQIAVASCVIDSSTKHSRSSSSCFVSSVSAYSTVAMLRPYSVNLFPASRTHPQTAFRRICLHTNRRSQSNLASFPLLTPPPACCTTRRPQFFPHSKATNHHRLHKRQVPRAFQPEPHKTAQRPYREYRDAEPRRGQCR